jgi:glycolate oxidase
MSTTGTNQATAAGNAKALSRATGTAALDVDALVRELTALLPGATVLPAGDRAEAYTHDESGLPHYAPQAVVLARSAEDVQAVLRFSRARGIPVVPRGAGSGKSGGALAERGGIVLSLEKMDRILEISHADMVAVVEPGVVLEKLQEAVEAEGLFYPPDPNSQQWCTLGGNLAHNAGGPRALKYGVTRDWVLGLEAVLPTGEHVRCGHRSWKGVAGYDLTQLIIGSEGTLAVVTRATLKLIPLPRRVETLLAFFPDEDKAATAVQRIFAAGLLPRACELFDATSMRAVGPRAPFKFPDGVGGALIVEFDGHGEGVTEELAAAGEECSAAGALDVVAAQDAAQRRKVWETRRMTSVALKDIRPHKISEDVAVPRGKLVELIRAVRAIGEKHGIETACYGHAGDGNLHVNLLFATLAEQERLHGAVNEVMDATLSLGGTITGEHGVGLAKRDYLAHEQSADLIALQRRLKSAFDPEGLLNPGKIFPQI